jgi:hypothetical protein
VADAGSVSTPTQDGWGAAGLIAVAAVLAACGSGDGGTSANPGGSSQSESLATTDAAQPSTGGQITHRAGDGERLPETPMPSPDPADFVAGIDNPYLPYHPGSTWTYLSVSPDEKTRIVTTVPLRTRVVQGVTCVVVHDVESTLDGEVLENTYDWYAQDSVGNVWYFGEDTTAYEDGKASKEGSWEAGVDGAQAGVIMLADPRPGDRYQQEYYEGEAEDHGEVLAVDARYGPVPAEYGDLIVTADTTPLEPKLLERKYYARGIGVAHEETVEGGREQVRLVSWQVTD